MRIPIWGLALLLALFLWPMRGSGETRQGQVQDQVHPQDTGMANAASAATAGRTEFTLESYLGTVAAGNLELAAQRANVSIAQAQIALAKVFPDPQLTAGVLQYDLSRQGNPTASIVSAGLPIELGGKRGARVAVAEAGLKASLADLEDFVRTLRASAANSYVEALHSRLVLDRKRKTLSSLERLIRVNEQRLAAGDIGEVQLVQSRVEGEKFRAEVIDAESAVRTTDLALVQLAGSEALPLIRRELVIGGDLQAAAERQFETEALVSFALAHRPDLSAASKRVTLAERAIELAHANRIPDVTVGASWQHNFATQGASALPATDFVGGTLTLPLPLSRLFYRGDLQAAHASKTQAETLAKSAAVRVEVEVRQAIAEYDKAAARVVLYKQGVLLDAEKVLEKTLYNYQHGGASLIEVLVAQRTADEIYLSYFDALADSAHALVAVEQATTRWDARF